MDRRWMSLSVAALLPLLNALADDLHILQVTGNGEISWQDTKSNGVYAVEWCPSLQSSDWRRDWLGMEQIPSHGGIITAKIPMFFRVVHRPRHSQTRNLCLVPGGGQPGGPSYDFYMAKYEVTNEEYVQFLNDAQLNPGTARGANMYFAANGDVWMGQGQYDPLFKASESWVLYNPAAAIGSRYLCPPEFLRHPITGVSWFGAVKFCNWLTVVEGRGESQRCYSEGSEYTNWIPTHLTYPQWEDGFDYFEKEDWCNNYRGFRLPMDDYASAASFHNEFYKAAAWTGVSNTTYAFGRNAFDRQDANCYSSGDPYEVLVIQTAPVGYYDGSNHGGTFQTRTNQNAYGIFDLSGNVEEWIGDEVAIRGGGWAEGEHACSTRETTGPGTTSRYGGLRVVSTYP